MDPSHCFDFSGRTVLVVGRASAGSLRHRGRVPVGRGGGHHHRGRGRADRARPRALRLRAARRHRHGGGRGPRRPHRAARRAGQLRRRLGARPAARGRAFERFVDLNLTGVYRLCFALLLASGRAVGASSTSAPCTDTSGARRSPPTERPRRGSTSSRSPSRSPGPSTGCASTPSPRVRRHRRDRGRAKRPGALRGRRRPHSDGPVGGAGGHRGAGPLSRLARRRVRDRGHPERGRRLRRGLTPPPARSIGLSPGPAAPPAGEGSLLRRSARGLARPARGGARSIITVPGRRTSSQPTETAMQLVPDSLAVNLIDGRWVEPATGRVIEVVNPSNWRSSGASPIETPPRPRSPPTRRDGPLPDGRRPRP